MATKAVFFDVDFTLIYPGPIFQGEGYRAFCERFGIQIDETKFGAAVAAAAALLDGPDDTKYDDARFSSATHGTSSSRWAAGERAWMPARVKSIGMGGLSALRAVRRGPGVLRRARVRRHPARVDFQLAPLSGVVPVAFRAAGIDCGDGLVIRSRLDEAASEHLRRRRSSW